MASYEHRVNDQYPNLDKIKDRSKMLLKNALEKMYGEQGIYRANFDIVIDDDLVSSLDTIAGGVALLREHGVDKIYKMEPGVQCLHRTLPRMYMVRPKVSTMKIIGKHINSESSLSHDNVYKIVFVPQRTLLCERVLEKEGILEKVVLDDLPLTLFVIDDDLVSMELHTFYRSLYLDGDQTMLRMVVEAIAEIMKLYGKIPYWRILGKSSKIVWQLLHHLTKEQPEKHDHRLAFEYPPRKPSDPPTTFEALYIFDRRVDDVSVMCFQQTFQGILDDTFGIKNGTLVEVPDKNEPGTVYKLNVLEDEIFRELRDMHFVHFPKHLSVKTSAFKGEHDEYKDKLSDRSNFKGADGVQNLRDTIETLKPIMKSKKSFTNVMHISEALMQRKKEENFLKITQLEENILKQTNLSSTVSAIGDMMHEQISIYVIFRLLCLLSLMMNGLSEDIYNQLKTLFLHSYGYEHLLTWYNLCKARILYIRCQNVNHNTSYYNRVYEVMRLPKGDENIKLDDPDQVSYVFGGDYTPLLPYLTSWLPNSGSYAKQDVDAFLSLYPNYQLIKVLSCKEPTSTARFQASKTNLPVLTYLVCMIGGCTFAEMAAFRLLQKKGYRVIVLTTGIINGNKVIDSLVEDTSAPAD